MTATPKRLIGAIIDAAGVKMELADGDLVTNVVVLAKIVQADGSVAVGFESDETATWLDELGLLHAALEIERAQRMIVSGED